MDMDKLDEAADKIKASRNEVSAYGIFLPCPAQYCQENSGIFVTIKDTTLSAIALIAQGVADMKPLFDKGLRGYFEIPEISLHPVPAMAKAISLQSMDAFYELMGDRLQYLHQQVFKDARAYMTFDGNFNIDIRDASINGRKAGDMHFQMEGLDFVSAIQYELLADELDRSRIKELEESLAREAEREIEMMRFSM